MAEMGRKTAEPAPLPSATAAIQEGRLRAVVDAILPVVDGGRFPVKRIAGEPVGSLIAAAAVLILTWSKHPCWE